MNNIEIGTALENFEYGSMVKISIPSLTPFINNKRATYKINTANIMNKDINSLKITSCECQNYLEILIPLELFRHKFDQKNLLYEYLPYDGSAGEQFVMSFIGGDINKPVVLRRY